MNQYIVPYDKAEFDGVELEVRRAESDDDWQVEQYIYNEPNQDIEVRIRLPNETKKLFDSARKEVQWVLETSDETAEIVSSAMCEGRRGYSMRHDEVIIIKLNAKDLKSKDYEKVELVAGWATGHEAVTLTPSLSLTHANSQQEL